VRPAHRFRGNAEPGQCDTADDAAGLRRGTRPLRDICMRPTRCCWPLPWSFRTIRRVRRLQRVSTAKNPSGRRRSQLEFGDPSCREANMPAAAVADRVAAGLSSNRGKTRVVLAAVRGVGEAAAFCGRRRSRLARPISRAYHRRAGDRRPRPPATISPESASNRGGRARARKPSPASSIVPPRSLLIFPRLRFPKGHNCFGRPLPKTLWIVSVMSSTAARFE
jgi:hypothetical protein